MKYLLVLFVAVCVNKFFAQANTDSLVNALISVSTDSLRPNPKSSNAAEKKIKPLIDLYFKLKIRGDKNNVPSLDFYNQFQIKNEYDFSVPSQVNSQSLSFTNYSLKKAERLEELNKLTDQQRENLLSALRNAQTKDSPEIAFVRKFLGVSQTTAALIFLVMSLAP